jgi:hypothetical protein
VNPVGAKGPDAIPIPGGAPERSSANKPLPAALIADLGVFRVSQASVHPQYDLHSSVILDSGATVYITNNPTRFTEMSPVTDDSFLYARDNHIPIKAYNTIKICRKVRTLW